MRDATNLRGDALIVLTRAEYDALVTDAADAARIADARQVAGPSMPTELAMQLLDGLHPLTAWRKTHGLTQAELAEKAGVRVATVSDIESGKIDPSLSTMVALAGALGVEVGDLVK